MPEIRVLNGGIEQVCAAAAAGQSYLSHRAEAEGEAAQVNDERADAGSCRHQGSKCCRAGAESTGGKGTTAQLYCNTWSADAPHNSPPQIWPVAYHSFAYTLSIAECGSLQSCLPVASSAYTESIQIPVLVCLDVPVLLIACDLHHSSDVCNQIH